MSTLQRRVWWALWPIGIAAVIAGDLGFLLNDWRPPEPVPLRIAVGTFSVVAGLLVWHRRPDNKIGILLYLAGVVWALRGLDGYVNPWTSGVAGLLDSAEVPLLAHALLAYPTGTIEVRWQRWLAALQYVVVPLNLVEVMTTNPARCEVPCPNAFLVWDHVGLHDAAHTAAGLLDASVFVGIVIIVGRWLRATRTARHVYTPVLAGALLTLAAAVPLFVLRTTTGEEPTWTIHPIVVARAVLPLTFVFGVFRGTIEQFGLGDFVIRLGARAASESLEQALGRALRDPSVMLAYWVPERAEFVDATGNAVQLPHDRDERVVTYVEREGERLAALIHDRAVLENPALIESVTAAASLALDNERLQAALRAQLEEVRASRTRIVQAGDEARRRIERDLHDGAQQRLLALALSLRMARDGIGESAGPAARAALEEVEDEMRAAIAELRELAQGIHPAILTEQGLRAAVESLAERTRVAVRIEVPDERFASMVEATAYFIVAEALSNIMKYSHATRACVRVERRAEMLVVEIEDDGIGGADHTRGSGLRGLDDRVAALGGSLSIQSAPGKGTRLRADIPCS